MSAQVLDKKDVRFSRFRLPHEGLSSAGSGCIAHHIPTNQSAMSEERQPYFPNQKAALAKLAGILGIKEGWDEKTLFHCKECGQELVPLFPDWQRAYVYHREFQHSSITIYSVEDDENMLGWTWEVDDYTGRDLFSPEPSVFETPEGAVQEAEKWAREFDDACETKAVE